MKLKSMFKQVNIPNVKPHVMAYAIQQGFSTYSRPTFLRRFSLQIATMLVLILGVGILFLSSNETEVYAFNTFDEALMSSMVSVEYLLDQYEVTEVESELTTTQYLFVEEAKSVFTYMKWLEIMTQNVRDFNVDKQVEDEEINYLYEVNDLNTRYEKSLRIKKIYQNIQQDEFTFSGDYQDNIKVEGYTLLEEGVHVLYIEAQKDDVTMFVTMRNDQSLKYDVVIDAQSSLLSVAYEVTYDEFGIPALVIQYEENEVEGNFTVTRRFDQRGFELSYTLVKEGIKEDGNIQVTYRLTPKFTYILMGQINEEDVRFIYIPNE
jgi:hypothetical protein